MVNVYERRVECDASFYLKFNLNVTPLLAPKTNHGTPIVNLNSKISEYNILYYRTISNVLRKFHITVSIGKIQLQSILL